MQDIKITVWDALMGSGKTTKIIDYMTDASKSNNLLSCDNDLFIYCAPYIEELHSIAGTKIDDCNNNKEPVLNADGSYFYKDKPQASLQFKHPNNKNKDGSKITGFKSLLDARHNVVTTHTLLGMLDAEDLGVYKDYTLIIDEALIAYESDYTLKSKTLERYIENGVISFKDDGITLQFNREHFANLDGKPSDYDSTKDTELEQFAKDCDKGLLYKFGGKVIKKFDVEVLKAFKKVMLLTYMFEGSMFSLLLKQHNIDYETEYFGKTVESVRDLITINGEKRMNKVGAYGLKTDGSIDFRKHSLTSSHYSKERIKTNKDYNKTNVIMHNHLYNMWMQREKIAPERRLWTSFTDDKSSISKGKANVSRFHPSHIAFNTKATNKYFKTDHLAYLVNVFIDSNYIKAASVDGFKLSQDHYALNTLIQWVWRSAIRDNKPIDLYIPSERMRDLLEAWLYHGYIPTYNTEGK